MRPLSPAIEYATRLDHAIVTYNRENFILPHDRLPWGKN
jgi:hypothetical protein